MHPQVRFRDEDFQLIEAARQIAFPLAEGVAAVPGCRYNSSEGRCAMNSIMATWKNGKIVPAEPVDWPEGSRLRVEPVTDGDELVPGDDVWGDDPVSIAAWEAGVRAIEPPVYTDEERAEMERYAVEFRRFNLEAVRKQMEDLGKQ